MKPTPSRETLDAARQQQFLDVVDRNTAEARFHAQLDLTPFEGEAVQLAEARGRILAEDVQARVDVPAFDRSNVDGFAVQAEDTSGAMEESPRVLALNDEVVAPGNPPRSEVAPGTATTIATGAVIPRGADSVVMVEHTRVSDEGQLLVEHAVAPGDRITFAGTDIALGETVLRRGQLLTSREIGVLAAIGQNLVPVTRQPRIAIISTGDEIIPPGTSPRIGSVYDSNAHILASAVEELGGVPVALGVFGDDKKAIQEAVATGLACDMVVLSGGTSKGAGDLSYQVVSELPGPGIVAHGVALKPGKPICLAVSDRTPVVILPGFPTSAVFTFHEFVAPVIRAWAGRQETTPQTVTATLPMRVNSERGRTEYMLVSLSADEEQLSAYPMGKGSGSVTTFSGADGFLTIDAQTEFLEGGSVVEVQLLGSGLEAADLVVIGSHCVGLDYLLGRLQDQGFRVKSLYVGSNGGLAAAKRGECDCGGIHLLDPESGTYNLPFLDDSLTSVPGYTRMQGIVYRPGDARMACRDAETFLSRAIGDRSLRMVNRNAGSGTRILLDQLLKGERPPGFAMQVRSHNAVGAAITQERADWGLAIKPVADDYGLEFLPLQAEQFDLVVPVSRHHRPAVTALRELLERPDVKKDLKQMGFETID